MRQLKLLNSQDLKQKISDNTRDNPHRKGTLSYNLKQNKIYGGSIRFKKFKRPLDAKKPIHVVFRVNKKLTLSLRKNTSKLNKMLMEHAGRFNIKIYNHSINTNHIHIILMSEQIENIGRFLRSFAGHTALFYKKSLGLEPKLWEGRPFTKIASWGKHFNFLKSYIIKNFKETVGFISYTPRTPNYQFLKNFGYA